MSLSVDLWQYWRVEERFAKAGYKIENVQMGFILDRMVPQAINYDFLNVRNGVYLIQIKGVTAFLIKTPDAIRFGTYEDHVAVGGKEVIDEFIKHRYPNWTPPRYGDADSGTDLSGGDGWLDPGADAGSC